MPRRVVITGMGVLSPIGNSVTEFNHGLKNGNNGIAPITHFDTTDFNVHIAGEVICNLEEKIEPGQGSISSDGLTAILSDSTDYNNCVEGSEIIVNNVSYKIVSKGDRQTLTLSDSLYCSDVIFNYNKSPQASHRISIDVRGSEVAGYHEWIKLPETWKREYTTLRSYNWLLTSIGSSLLNMTFILIFIFSNIFY